MADGHADVLTADFAAKYLRVSLNSLYRLVGQALGQEAGRSWRLYRTDLVAFLQAGR